MNKTKLILFNLDLFLIGRRKPNSEVSNKLVHYLGRTLLGTHCKVQLLGQSLPTKPFMTQLFLTNNFFGAFSVLSLVEVEIEIVFF